MSEFERKSDEEILRERADSERRRGDLLAAQLGDLRAALGVPDGQHWGGRAKALVQAESALSDAIKARDVAETMYHIERRRADRLQAELEGRGA